MTVQMIQVPDEDWAEMVFLAEANEDHECPELERPTSNHVFQPNLRGHDPLCTANGCGGSRMNPVHYV